ncbi:hypothetical protein ACDQ55_11425 [Chitinophaga sp. 30R24]|uniref:hypothetical protein n=1 Tax=Chitinophaga sp. 30R24 TaxID=3248838 RepID=UPI003B91E431
MKQKIMNANHIIYILALSALLYGCGRITRDNMKVPPALYTLAATNKEIAEMIRYSKKIADPEKSILAVQLLEQVNEGYALTLNTPISDRRILLPEPPADIPLSVIKMDTIWDRDVMTADYFIRNLELSYYTRKNYPWTVKLSLDDFCRYVLPYRASTEPLSEWKQFFHDKYNAFIRQIPHANMDSLRDIVSYVDGEIIGWKNKFTIQNIVWQSSSLDSIKKQAALTDAEDLAVIKLNALRAVGIASSMEVIPCIRGKGESAFFVFKYPSSEVFQLFNRYQQIYYARVPKVWRKAIAKDGGFNPVFTLSQERGSMDDIPLVLNLPGYIDVTCERTSTSDLIVPSPDSSDACGKKMYITTYDLGAWRIVDIGLRKGKEVIFSQMGHDIIYHLAYYENKSIQLIGSPFLFDGQGKVIAISQDHELIPLMKVTECNQWKNIMPDSTYTCFYWHTQKHKWMKNNIIKAGDNFLEIRQMPYNTLYKIETSNKNESVHFFQFKNNKQIWN